VATFYRNMLANPGALKGDCTMRSMLLATPGVKARRTGCQSHRLHRHLTVAQGGSGQGWVAVPPKAGGEAPGGLYQQTALHLPQPSTWAKRPPGIQAIPPVEDDETLEVRTPCYTTPGERQGGCWEVQGADGHGVMVCRAG
jgi:hypothetical protein